MAIILRNLAKVPITEDNKLEILKMYTYSSFGGETLCNYKYKRGADEVYLPLNHKKLEKVAALTGLEIVDERSKGKELQAPFVLNTNFKLRPYQEKPAQEYMDYLLLHKNGMLDGSCGSGKTRVTTYVAGQLERKILVLVDMSSLASQWQEAFQGVWNKKAQILKSGDSRFADCCIATFQLLNKNDSLLKRIREEFGCIISDEAHTNPCKSWRNVLYQLDAEYRLGVSATIYRKGFGADVIKDLIGPVATKMVNPDNLVPTIYFVNTGIRWLSDNQREYSTNIAAMAVSEPRNELVLSLVKKAVAAGRRVIVAATTIEQCNCLTERSKEFCKPVSYIGATSLKQDLAIKTGIENGDINVLFTVKKLLKGVDLPLTDTLILANPNNNEAITVQTIGRILRVCEGKKDPLVIDLVDEESLEHWELVQNAEAKGIELENDYGSLAKRFANNRRKWYKKLKYIVIEK